MIGIYTTIRNRPRFGNPSHHTAPSISFALRRDYFMLRNIFLISAIGLLLAFVNVSARPPVCKTVCCGPAGGGNRGGWYVFDPLMILLYLFFDH